MRKIDRFDKYMKSKGLNDNKVTVQLGLSVGTLGKSRKENRDLSEKNIEKILNFYTDISKIWLLTGDGDMLKNTQIVGGDISGTNIQQGRINTRGGHNVVVNGDLDGKKIIRPDEIEIKQESNAEEKLLQEITSLKNEISRLEVTIKSKDETIESQKRYLESIIAAKDETIAILLKQK